MTTALQIPTLHDGTAYYRSKLTLDGQEYILDMGWSDRYQVWSLTLRDGTGDLLLGPVRCYSDRPMLKYYHADPRVPTGELMVVRSDQYVQLSPGLYDLGIGRAGTLTYFPAAEE